MTIFYLSIKYYLIKTWRRIGYCFRRETDLFGMLVEQKDLVIKTTNQFTIFEWPPRISQVELPALLNFSFRFSDTQFDPIIQLNTEKIIINDPSMLSRVDINWKKFPKLKHLEISSHDANMDGIETCVDMETLRITTNTMCVSMDQFVKMTKLVQQTITVLH